MVCVSTLLLGTERARRKILLLRSLTKDNLIQCQNAESCGIGGVTPPSVVKLWDYKIRDLIKIIMSLPNLNNNNNNNNLNFPSFKKYITYTLKLPNTCFFLASYFCPGSLSTQQIVQIFYTPEKAFKNICGSARFSPHAYTPQ